MPGRLVGLIGFFAMLSAGCEGRGEIRGQIAVGEKPVKLGTVTVWAKDGIPRAVVLDREGKFVVPDLPTGEAAIAVVSPEPKQAVANLYNRELPKGVVPPPTPVAPIQETLDAKDWMPISNRYADAKTTDLKVVVKAGTNNVRFSLTK